MTNLGLAAALQIALFTSGTENYADAHKAATESGVPMVVMVTADWCGACVQMKQNVLPQVKQHGLLRKVAFAVVDLDRERELGAQLTHGGPIPQLLLFRKAGDGWRMRKLIGGQDVNAVEGFINEGIQANAAEEKNAQGSASVKTASNETAATVN